MADTKICEFCGHSFKPKRPEQRFCDRHCAIKWTVINRRSMTGENNPNYGKKHTDETRAKIAQAAAGRTASLKTRKKMSMTHRGRKKSKEWRENISKALTNNPNLKNAGEMNPNYKHGKYVNERVYRKLVQLGPCEECGETAAIFDVHHLDGDHENNEPDNLQVLCHSCHGKKHGRPPGIVETKPRQRRKSS